MVSRKDANKARKQKHLRVRSKVSGTTERPRLCVYRSLANIYAQVIDDTTGKTLVSASSAEASFGKAGGNKENARKVGALVAERAGKAGIVDVVFDRGGYLYHGCVKELADGAREGGLKF